MTFADRGLFLHHMPSVTKCYHDNIQDNITVKAACLAFVTSLVSLLHEPASLHSVHS